ncbi:AraC-like ligand binding domain-containing protein [Malonomonas rubra DSM 5091]|uniref:AraC-like ligand binding domain-containing protein n=1 Tax=Malonomonas rubra DSM 5091 TaxID=1122189 RepID=A0A1M6I5C3_MALRU|nr:AraC family transcriptional regulator [Malonomonas rubra]SHJ29619.1 AraC-like ligand binding domain-containing protein [Malonomonas rubra DSM 5091]
MRNCQVRYFKPEGLSGLELLSCPDVNYLFPPHFHDAYCIWLNSSGGERYRHSGNSSILQPGHFGIIAPGEVHENYACENDRRNLLTFYLAPSQLQSLAAQIRDVDSDDCEFRTDFYRDNEAYAGLIQLHQTLYHSDSKLEKETAFIELLALLISRHTAKTINSAKFGQETERVNKIIELFHEQIEEDFGLSELAQQFDCTPYHLIRFFKKAVGIAPHAYLVQMRLEKAKQLISEGDSLVDAALATGFADQSHLTRHFKNKFGVTPGIYRKQVLG